MIRDLVNLTSTLFLSMHDKAHEPLLYRAILAENYIPVTHLAWVIPLAHSLACLLQNEVTVFFCLIPKQVLSLYQKSTESWEIIRKKSEIPEFQELGGCANVPIQRY